MSGTFKSSTIEKEKKKTMWSLIKSWKRLQEGAFNGLIRYNDLMYGILHLVELQKFTKEVEKSDNCIVERGVTDTLFFYKRTNELPEDTIAEILQEENSILSGFDVKKILLVQEDYKFVNEVILKNIYRKNSFSGGIEEYKKLQEDYVEFTCKTNHIDDIVRIKNAREYVENTLGETFNPENL